jgi:hypothetical protein
VSVRRRGLVLLISRLWPSITPNASFFTPLKKMCAPKLTWATSLAQSVKERLPGLRLRGDELICHNWMCEKVGETCLCQLSMLLSRLQHLRHLDLRSNRLNRLPEVWTLQNLESLDVRDNALQALPEELASMPALHTLRVEGNPLREGGVPASVAALLDSRDEDLG